MGTRSRLVWVFLFLGLLFIGVIQIPYFRFEQNDSAELVASTQWKKSGVPLVPPAFAQETGLKFPEIEAGISAYLHIDQAVDLRKAEGLFQGIEAKGEDYLIGIVELEGLPEEMWPHLYVDTDGWFLAYYSKYDPAGKLFPWNTYQGGSITSTTLRDALDQFTTALFSTPRVPFEFCEIEAELKYYDFRYPKAAHLVLAVDEVTTEGWDSFRYAIPWEAEVFEGSWIHYLFPPVSGSCGASCWSETRIDDVKLHTAWYERGDNPQLVWGRLKGEFLVVNQLHVVSVGQGRKERYCFAAGRSGIVIAFIYQ
ncbi:MAG: hypothetical protein DRI26_02190 [Chloroflexi bacterium]|nr:MAG: hypothetical protein DRI26_02190 [Chloroflexota bacterium]